MTSNVAFLSGIALVACLGAVARGRTILDLQPDKTSTYLRDHDETLVTLYNLNPKINKWFLLELEPKGGGSRLFHLENPDAKDQTISLDKETKSLKFVQKDKVSFCKPWSLEDPTNLRHASSKGTPFTSLCNGMVFLRNRTVGYQSVKEKAVEFLRNKVWNGESIISFIKDTIYKDAELIRSTAHTVSGVSGGLRAPSALSALSAPLPARIDAVHQNAAMTPTELGIKAQVESNGDMIAGQWYKSTHNNSVYVSAAEPQFIDRELLTQDRNVVLDFDATERSAMIYLVAFDMTHLDIGYSVGTEHPEVTYSERTSNSQKTPGWPGPDGIKDYAPLVSTGMLSPAEASKVLATFTGGFKRKHSVFRVGSEAARPGGSHYGFMQNGVVFSTLHQGLATALVTEDGGFELKTFEPGDEARIGTMLFARQNGLPLVYRNNLGRIVPGEYVRENYRGNWSGSEQNTVRAMRSGLCLQKNGDKKFVIYGLFSGHTPNAMARVFQSYHCDYAMHLDMNMVIHTYLATYFRDQKGKFHIEHILKEMKSRDQYTGTDYLPRFVAVPDNRDFFYIMHSEGRDKTKDDLARSNR